MSITLELSEEEEADLRLAAERAGSDVASFVLSAIWESVRRSDPSADAAFLQREGATAVRRAQAHLVERGIGYVTGDEEHVTIHS